MNIVTGNIFRMPSSKILYIAVGERTVVTSSNTYGVFDWISFDSERSSGCFRMETSKEKVYCDCNYDIDCPACSGTGYVEKERLGMDKAIKVASNVEEFILNKIRKVFDL